MGGPSDTCERKSGPIPAAPSAARGAVHPAPLVRLAVKRTLDCVVGALLTALTLPLVIMLAIWSAAAYRAWPFFTHERIGQHGRHFTFIKIRSLPPATSTYTLKHAVDQNNLPQLARFLRGRHLDELPQLWLVAVGRMSLVGPRPKMPDAVEPVDPHYARVRTRVPQGCTGLWQVSANQGELPSETPQYEFYYLAHGCLRMDLWIVWRTTLQMIGLAKPISLDMVPAWAHGAGWVPAHDVDVALA